MTQARLFNSDLSPSRASSRYSFIGQEEDYYHYRPKWPKEFAIAALEKAGIHFDASNQKWLGIADRTAPIIVSIGSGAGSDAMAFLQLGCTVFGVEPNAVLREFANKVLSDNYPDKFHSVNGTAHSFILPMGLKADLIVCAQALHTFTTQDDTARSGHTRRHWQTYLPDDCRKRLSIWYYNLDPSEKIWDLHQRLQCASETYAKSQTAFVDAPLFEPAKFQHYINATEMDISSAQPVDKKILNLPNLLKWIKSYSFYPKDKSEEEKVIATLSDWFNTYKNESNEVELPCIGYITQGPLRMTPFFNHTNNNDLELSPITLQHRMVNRCKLT